MSSLLRLCMRPPKQLCQHHAATALPSQQPCQLNALVKLPPWLGTSGRRRELKQATESGKAQRISWPPSAALGVTACSRKPYHRIAAIAPIIYSVVQAVAEAPVSPLRSADGLAENEHAGSRRVDGLQREVGAKGERRNRRAGTSHRLFWQQQAFNSPHQLSQKGAERTCSHVILVMFGDFFLGFLFTKSVSLPSSYLWSWHIEIRESNNP